MKLKKGDEVIITRGKDKGKRGKIEKVFDKLNSVLIPGLNVYKRHYKSRVQDKPSEIRDIVRPFPAQNVSLVCPNCHKETRIAYKLDNKEKVRICAKCEKKI